MNPLELTLGIMTAVGGFVDISELVFAAKAGSTFGYALIWVFDHAGDAGNRRCAEHGAERDGAGSKRIGVRQTELNEQIGHQQSGHCAHHQREFKDHDRIELDGRKGALEYAPYVHPALLIYGC